MIITTAKQNSGSDSSPPNRHERNVPYRDVFMPHTAKQLAAVYHVSRRTMFRWLKKIEHIIGKRQGYLFTPHQVRLIVGEYGPPPDL